MGEYRPLGEAFGQRDCNLGQDDHLARKHIEWSLEEEFPATYEYCRQQRVQKYPHRGEHGICRTAGDAQPAHSTLRELFCP